jgi:hypothetical protein
MEYFLNRIAVLRNWIKRIKQKALCFDNSLKTTTLPNGTCFDLDTRILHCLFDELVLFVERDCAKQYDCLMDTDLMILIPNLNSNREKGLRFLTYRADDFNDMNDSEDPFIQKSIKECEQLAEIYIWWKDVYLPKFHGDSDIFTQCVFDKYDELTEKISLLVSLRKHLKF